MHDQQIPLVLPYNHQHSVPVNNTVGLRGISQIEHDLSFSSELGPGKQFDLSFQNRSGSLATMIKKPDPKIQSQMTTYAPAIIDRVTKNQIDQQWTD